MTLVGRDEVIAELRELLEVAPRLVVVGPPGVGKSAVAGALAPDLWVDLEGVSTCLDARERVAQAMGQPLASWGAVAELLPDGLVVLDGVEALGGELASVLRQLPAASVLMTSRVRPDLSDPVLELAPLGPADGARLLRTLLRSVQRKRTVPDEALRELSVALDGLPLALELAARRLRLYRPDQVAAGGVEALRDPGRPARQDLLAQVEASVEALAPSPRRVLTRAARLPGPFSAELLAVACGGPVDDELLVLLDASLIHTVGGEQPTFRVLAPVREVAVARADPGWEEALARLATRLLGSAEEAVEHLDGPLFEPGEVAGDAALLELLVDSTDPTIRLRAALVLAARERHSGRVQRTLARDQLVPDEGPRGLRVRWAFAVDAAASAVGAFDRAEAVLARVDALLTDEERAAAMSSRALIAQSRGLGERALQLAEAAVEQGSDPWLHYRLAAVWMHHRRYVEAAEALRRAQAVRSAFRRAQATLLRGRLQRLIGVDPAAIEAELASVAPVAKRARHTWLSARLHQLRGVLAADRGEIAVARRHLRHAEAERRRQRELGSALGPIIDRHQLDYIDGGVPEALLQPVPGPLLEVEQAWLDIARATVHAALGHVAAALALGPPAIDVLGRHGDPAVSELVCPLAVALGPHDRSEALELLDALPADDLVADDLVRLARSLLDGAAPPTARRMEERVIIGIAARQRSRVRVQRDGRSFVASDGSSVDLGRRRVLSRVLAALAARDEGLGVDELCERVWPGQKLVGSSGTRRVHVAISSLRGLGLRQAILTEQGPDGAARWRLDALREGPAPDDL